MAEKYSINKIENYLRENGFYLMGDYINSKTPTIFSDEEGYKYSLSIDALKISLKNNLIPMRISTKNNFTIENINWFLERNKSNIRVVGGKYSGNIKKTLLISCLICEKKYYDTWNNMNRRDFTCEKCDNSHKINTVYLLELFQKNNLEIINLRQYINEDSKIDIRCLVCDHVWKSTYRIIRQGRGCPKCSPISSSGEIIVESTLNELGIRYENQKTFPGCKHKKLLRFDFYLPDFNMVLEYQGEQHYFPVSFLNNGVFFDADERFQYQKNIDEIKRKYCKSYNIQLIEIPYWEKSNIGEIIKNIIGGY